MKIIKVGIWGFGYMGYKHYNMLQNDKHYQITAVCDINPLTFSKLSSNEIKTYVDGTLFLKNGNFDLVIIALPNYLHFNSILQAFDMKKHIICEKPCVISLREMENVAEIAAKSNQIFTVHHNRRWDSDFVTVKSILAQKAIGDPIAIDSLIYGQIGKMYGWRSYAKYGGGILLDWGVHLIDQLLDLLNSHHVISVYGELRSVMTKDADDYCSIVLNFDNGVIGRINVGTFSLQKLPRWFIYGNRGTMLVNNLCDCSGQIALLNSSNSFETLNGLCNSKSGPTRLMGAINDELIKKSNLPKIQLMDETFYDNFYNAVLQDQPLLISLNDVMRNMKIIDAVWLSNINKKVINVNI